MHSSPAPLELEDCGDAKRPTTPIEMTTGGRYEFLARANRVIST